MIGIDTNVLVRFLVQDDPDQSALATSAFGRLTGSDPGHLATVVLVEAFWVLSRGYKLGPSDVVAALEELAASEEIVLQDPGQVAAAFDAARTGVDFADALIASACSSRGCRTVWSFDVRAQAELGFVSP